MSTRKALIFSFVDRYSSLLMAIASSMAIARLLRPDELGIFSVAMALLLLASTVRDMGAGQYIVQAIELTPERIKAVWTIQIGIGAILALLVMALAVPAAAFYREPKILPILLVTGISYLLNPFGSITYAMLMREMAFGKIAIIRFSASLSGALVSVGLAATNHGPISLAWGSLAGTTANALVAQIFRPAGMPWGFALRGVPEVLGFGSRIAGTSIISSIVNSTPDFVLGKLQGMQAAGLFSRSNGLVAMFSRLITDAISGVAIGLFARQRRENLDVRPGFLRAMSYITVLSWTFSAGLALFSHPLTRVLYGTQWDGSVSLTRWLALAGGLVAPVHMCVVLLTALGRADLLMKATFASGTVTVLATVAGALLGFDTIGKFLALSSLCAAYFWLRTAKLAIDVNWTMLFSTFRGSAITASITMVGPVIVALLMGLEQTNPLLILLAGAFSGLACAIIAVFVTNHPIQAELRPMLNRLIARHQKDA